LVLNCSAFTAAHARSVETVKETARERRERVENIRRDPDALSMVGYLSVVGYQFAPVAHPVPATVSDVSAETWEVLEALEAPGTPPSRIRRARAACWQSTQTPSS
jgi:hypothetical protein